MKKYRIIYVEGEGYYPQAMERLFFVFPVWRRIATGIVSYELSNNLQCPYERLAPALDVIHKYHGQQERRKHWSIAKKVEL